MRRHLVRICAFLVLGAIVSIAVAWGNVIRIEYYDVRLGWGPEQSADMWARLALLDWPAQPKREHRGEAFGVREYSAEAGEVYSRGGTTTKYLMIEKRAGWPLLGLRHVSRLDRDNPGWLVDGSLRVNIAIGRQPYLMLPFHPMWPGFAINTVFYAVIVWLLFAASFALRRRRRIKRGLCPKCAYDLRGAAGGACPECGVSVSAKPRRGASTAAQGNAPGLDRETPSKP